jgi:hypothetical protein
MSNQPRVRHPIYNLLPTEIEGFDSLAELALDLRWSWNHATDGVWRTLDPRLWGTCLPPIPQWPQALTDIEQIPISTLDSVGEVC